MHAQPYAGALEAVERILNRESEADEVLRQTVDVVHDRIEDYAWVGLSFVEDGTPCSGRRGARTRAGLVSRLPSSTTACASRRSGGDRGAAAEEDTSFLERVADPRLRPLPRGMGHAAECRGRARGRGGKLRRG